MKISKPLTLALYGATLLSFASVAPANQKMKPIRYAAIKPLMVQQCVQCHNSQRHAEGVDVSSFATIMKGGEHGPLVIPGHPEKSAMISYVDGTKMPRMPMRGAPLKAAQISLLKQWILTGAKN